MRVERDAPGVTLTSLVSLAGGILAILAIVGASVAVLASTRQKVTIETLKADNEAQRSWNETVERKEQDCQARLDKAETRVTVLTDAVTNAKLVAEMLARAELVRADIAAGHAEVEALGRRVDANFSKVIHLLAGKAEK